MTATSLEIWAERLTPTARALPYPPTPRLAAVVGARLVEKPVRSPAIRPWQVALLMLALIALAVLAVPTARAAVVQFIQIGVVRILVGPATAAPGPPPTVVPTASNRAAAPTPPSPRPSTATPRPTATPISALLDSLSGETTLAGAQANAGFKVLLPAYPSGLGAPDRVFLQTEGAPLVVLVWVDPAQSDQVRLALFEIVPGNIGLQKSDFTKGVPPSLQNTTVHGQPAAWTTGPYLLELQGGNLDFYRLIDGHVLIWLENGITYRLELASDSTMAQAVMIAEFIEVNALTGRSAILKGRSSMNRIVRSAVSLCLLVLLAACAPALTPAAAPSGGAPTSAPPTPQPQPTAVAPTAQPSTLFFARPQGDAGLLMAYDMAAGALRFTLPPGLLSADSQHYLAAQTSADTQLAEYDLTTGASTPIARLTSQWELSSLSATGQWAALTRLPSDGEKQAWSAADAWQTEVQVLDTTTGQVVHQIDLAGNFEVDTLSPAGDTLFVIQYLPALKPDHYQVRLYDLTTETLQDGALVDKRAPDEVMAGQRWQAVAPSDGSWLFTLYLRTNNNTAFIHALNTEGKFTLCFDLPTVPGNTLDQLRAYSLALSPHTQIVYAANPALGIVAEIDLNSYEVARATNFAPDPSAQSASTPINYSVADQHSLYFTGGQNIWSFDAATKQVKSFSSLDAFISGLALGADGRHLFVARPDQLPMTLDTASGAALSSQ